MRWLTHQHVLAQIKRTDITNLPTGDSLSSNNVQKGFTIAFSIAGGVALIMIAYGALKYVLSRGNPQEVAKAKDTILNGVIGLVLIITAGSIISFVTNSIIR